MSPKSIEEVREALASMYDACEFGCSDEYEIVYAAIDELAAARAVVKAGVALLKAREDYTFDDMPHTGKALQEADDAFEAAVRAIREAT